MKNKKILFSILIFVAILLISNICIAGDLDIINDYTITIEPRMDGTLDMTYHLEWKVLDSTTEGPLEWVKIGIPNGNVDSIKAISKNIQNISYYQDNGDFVRIDFKQSYEENSTIDIDFKLHQSYMYTLNEGSCKYSFTPGWFDDINVKKLTIRWDASKVSKYTPKASTKGGYLIWTKNNLLKGTTYTVDITYPADAFNTDSSMQFYDATITTKKNSFFNGGEFSIYIIIAIIAFFFLFVGSIMSGFGYSSHRGLGYSSRSYWDDDDDWSSSSYSSHSSSSCVSSCACACACAGGGRAGCSKKDLYGTNVRTQKLNKILNS